LLAWRRPGCNYPQPPGHRGRPAGPAHRSATPGGAAVPAWAHQRG